MLCKWDLRVSVRDYVLICLEVFLVLISWNWNQIALVSLWLLCGFSCHQNKSKVTFNKKRGKSIFVIVFSLITLWPLILKSCQFTLKNNVETNFEGFWKQNEKESFLTKRKRNKFIDHILKNNFVLKNFRKNIKVWRRKIVQLRQNFKKDVDGVKLTRNGRKNCKSS